MLKNKSQSPIPSFRKVAIQLAFPEAIRAVIGGAKIQRLEWTDKKEYGLLQDSFLKIHKKGEIHNWIVSEGDLMARDWVIV